MKIGIITLHFHTNYGGYLQAYALQYILRKYGNDVYVLNNIMQQSFLMRIRDQLSKWKLILRTDTQTRRLQACLAFAKRNIKQMALYGHQQELDTIIVGSDQIWRARFHSEFVPAMLDFTTNWNIHRIAYACSLGTRNGNFQPADYELARRCLKRFEAVSMREEGALPFIKDQLQYQGPLEATLDPTLLLPANHYISKFATKGIDSSIPEKGIFYYILDPTEQKQKIVKQISDFLCLPTYTVNNDHSYPIENWLVCFKHAAYVVTDSFHGTALSINFNKPFITIGNDLRGMERFHSLLSAFKLQNRLITDNMDIPQELLYQAINFREVNQILKQKRKESLYFLEKYVNNS